MKLFLASFFRGAGRIFFVRLAGFFGACEAFWDGWMCCLPSVEHSCRTRLLLQSFPGFSIPQPESSPRAWLFQGLSLVFSLLEPLSRCPGDLACLSLSLQVPSVLLGLKRAPQGQLAASSFLKIQELCPLGLE